MWVAQDKKVAEHEQTAKNTRRGNATTSPVGIRGAAVAAIVLLAVAIVVPLGVGGWRAQHVDTRPTVPSTPATAPARQLPWPPRRLACSS